MENNRHLMLDESIACLYYEEAEKEFETKNYLLTLVTWETWKNELGEMTMRLKGSTAKKLDNGKYDVIYIYTRFYPYIYRDALEMALDELICSCKKAGIENPEIIDKEKILELYYGK